MSAILNRKRAAMHKEMRRLRYRAWKTRCWLGAVASKSKTMSWDLNCEKRKRKEWNAKFPIDGERTNLIIRERGLEVHMARKATGWENKAEIVAKDLGAAVGKLNTALMKAEKVRFSLEEAKRLETANDVSKKVKSLRDTVENLTEMSSFFSKIASPYFPTQFKPEGAESEKELFSVKCR